jgi:diacylglycerol kinase (ATP)
MSSLAAFPSVTIFANPVAGRGHGRSKAVQLARDLREAGFEVATKVDSPAAVADAEISPGSAAVVVGGDGTLRSVAGKYFEKFRRVPPILPVPMGTANLMGKHLGISWDSDDWTHRVADSLRRGIVRQLDAATANGELFLLVAGVGIDAGIVHELSGIRRGPINYASYLLPAAKTLAAYDYPPLSVWMDGREVFPQEPAVAFVGNVSEYGTGFPLLPHAESNDGLLDLCVIPMRSRGDAIQHFLRAVVGEHLLGEGVVHGRGRKIDIRSPEAIPVQVDGDPAGHTPLHIDLLPIRVPFIVPVAEE